jgi:ribosomal protein L32
MNAQNCPRCGRIFTRITSPVCKECENAEKEKFEVVRAYVKENPHSSAQEVSEACDVSVKRLLQYVREGRLEISQGMEGLATCSKCGQPIKSGRMCQKCTRNMTSALSGMMSVAAAVKDGPKDASKDNKGMYTTK